MKSNIIFCAISRTRELMKDRNKYSGSFVINKMLSKA